MTENTAWACSCAQVTPLEAARNADAVFTGTALGHVAPERPGFEERVEFIGRETDRIALAAIAAVAVAAVAALLRRRSRLA